MKKIIQNLLEEGFVSKFVSVAISSKKQAKMFVFAMTIVIIVTELTFLILDFTLKTKFIADYHEFLPLFLPFFGIIAGFVGVSGVANKWKNGNSVEEDQNIALNKVEKTKKSKSTKKGEQVDYDKEDYE